MCARQMLSIGKAVKGVAMAKYVLEEAAGALNAQSQLEEDSVRDWVIPGSITCEH